MRARRSSRLTSSESRPDDGPSACFKSRTSWWKRSRGLLAISIETATMSGLLAAIITKDLEPRSECEVSLPARGDDYVMGVSLTLGDGKECQYGGTRNSKARTQDALPQYKECCWRMIWFAVRSLFIFHDKRLSRHGDNAAGRHRSLDSCK